jgi:hypothetical protein
MRYAAEWRRFIESIHYNVPHTDEEHFRMLTQLTSGDPARITMLFRMIDRNLTLSDTPPERERNGAARGLAERMAQKRLKRLAGKNAGAFERAARSRLAQGANAPVVGDIWDTERVHAEFEGFLSFCPATPPQNTQTDAQGQWATPARHYEERLESLRNAVERRVMEGGPGADAPRIAELNLNFQARQAEARTVTAALIAAQPLVWRPRFECLLTPPLNEAVPLPPPAPVVPGVVPVPVMPAAPPPSPCMVPTARPTLPAAIVPVPLPPPVVPPPPVQPVAPPPVQPAAPPPPVQPAPPPVQPAPPPAQPAPAQPAPRARPRPRIAIPQPRPL